MKLRIPGTLGLGGLIALGLAPAPALAAPPVPQDLELHAGYDNSITVSWEESPGATSYRIYRGTAAGGEGGTPIATVTGESYKDNNLSATPTYFYQVTAVSSSGESARSEEDASKTPPPQVTGGNVAGVASGNSLIFYCKDARRDGFDWFQTLTGWFPSVLGSSGSASPNTGNLRNFRPFESVGLGGGDDDRWLDCVLWTFGLGAFEGPAGDFSFDDAGVGASPSWWEQAA